MIIIGQTTNMQRKTKKARFEESQLNRRCAVMECTGSGKFSCNHVNISSSTRTVLNCTADGLVFCDMHGPNHEQHNFQMLVPYSEGELSSAISKAQERLKLAEKRKKKQKETMDNQVRTMIVNTNKAQSIASRSSKVTRINRSIELLAAIDDIVQEGEVITLAEAMQPLVTTSSEVFEAANIPSASVDEVPFVLDQVTLNQLNSTGNISPKVFNHRRSSSLKPLPQLAIDIGDKRYNCMLHQQMKNIFNGRGLDPEVKFVEALNFSQYKNILKELIPMYGLDESLLPSNENLGEKKNREAFLKALYALF